MPDDSEDDEHGGVQQKIEDIEGTINKRLEFEAEAEREMQERLEGLQEKIVALKKEQLDAQTEAMKLNKEKRELKLELQSFPEDL